MSEREIITTDESAILFAPAVSDMGSPGGLGGKFLHRSKIFITRLRQRAVFHRWVAARGDKTLRLDYELDQHSLVFDLGGYEGNWASDIYSMYQSHIYVFEPVPDFFSFISYRFRFNRNIQVFGFGLAEESRKDYVHINADSSGKHNKDPLKEKTPIELVEIDEFLKNNKIDSIDLIKINIEGAEFDLMEHIIANDLHKKMKNIQIQFHIFAPNSVSRTAKIRRCLRETHDLTYYYDLIWENWRIKD